MSLDSFTKWIYIIYTCVHTILKKLLQIPLSSFTQLVRAIDSCALLFSLVPFERFRKASLPLTASCSFRSLISQCFSNHVSLTFWILPPHMLCLLWNLSGFMWEKLLSPVYELAVSLKGSLPSDFSCTSRLCDSQGHPEPIFTPYLRPARCRKQHQWVKLDKNVPVHVPVGLSNCIFTTEPTLTLDHVRASWKPRVTPLQC